METQFFTFVAGLINDGSISLESLSLLNFLALCSICYYLIRPTYVRINLMPNFEEINGLIEKSSNVAAINILSEKVDKLSETLNSLETYDITYTKDMEEIKSDIEQVKQILNQFQGHMLYGNRTEFGNRELR